MLKMAGETALEQRTGTCRYCKLPVREIEPGLAVVEGTDTTADGLTFCPPDPDTTRRVHDHRI